MENNEILTKKCTKCNLIKLLDNFNYHPHGKYKKRSTCRECEKVYNASVAEARNKKAREYYLLNKEIFRQKHKEYRDNNKEKVSEQGKKYYNENKEATLTRSKKWYHNNKERKQQSVLEWCKNNPEKVKAISKRYNKKARQLYKEDRKSRLDKWTKDNIEYVRKYHREYFHKRKNSDPNFAIATKLRRRISAAVNSQNVKKNNKSLEMIGCSLEFLLNYLESKFYNTIDENGNIQIMTRELLCTKEVHLDHIIPVWKFNLINPEEQYKCFHYSNLQPLWRKDHAEKTKKDMIEFMSLRYPAKSNSSLETLL